MEVKGNGRGRGKRGGSERRIKRGNIRKRTRRRKIYVEEEECKKKSEKK